MDREDERRRDISRKYRNRRIVENKSPNNDLPELKKKNRVIEVVSYPLVRSSNFRGENLQEARFKNRGEECLSKERDPVDTRATIRVIRTGPR